MNSIYQIGLYVRATDIMNKFKKTAIESVKQAIEEFDRGECFYGTNK